jgi:hypothetical protein
MYFLSFGGPTKAYHDAVLRIGKEAASFQLFDTIVTATDETLTSDSNFWSKHGRFIETSPKGYGYWIWKPWLIKKALASMTTGDILVYADAGCTLHVEGLPRLLEYIDLVKEHGALVFQTEHLEETLTKMDVIHAMQAHALMKTGQIHATTFLLQKSDTTVDLVDSWYEAVCNYSLLDDTPSKAPNCADIKDHRHDQSMWSILCKQRGVYTIPDETWAFSADKKSSYPIWAQRKVRQYEVIQEDGKTYLFWPSSGFKQEIATVPV